MMPSNIYSLTAFFFTLFHSVLFATQQLVVVEAENSSATYGKLYTYEFQESCWQAAMDPIDCALGANGLASGKGLLPGSFPQIPEKVEGDKKTPLGTFSLGKSFGFSHLPLGNFPYHPITDQTEAVDDPHSKYYNCIVDANAVDKKDWQSSEKMLTENLAYEWGMEILHNSNPPIPEKGSAIFLHICKHPHSPTAGCVAIEKNSLQKLMKWLDKDKSPLFIITLKKKNTNHET